MTYDVVSLKVDVLDALYAPAEAYETDDLATTGRIAVERIAELCAMRDAARAMLAALESILTEATCEDVQALSARGAIKTIEGLGDIAHAAIAQAEAASIGGPT